MYRTLEGESSKGGERRWLASIEAEEINKILFERAKNKSSVVITEKEDKTEEAGGRIGVRN